MVKNFPHHIQSDQMIKTIRKLTLWMLLLLIYKNYTISTTAVQFTRFKAVPSPSASPHGIEIISVWI